MMFPYYPYYIFSFLAGEGAFQWAMEQGLTMCDDKELITGLV